MNTTNSSLVLSLPSAEVLYRFVIPIGIVLIVTIVGMVIVVKFKNKKENKEPLYIRFNTKDFYMYPMENYEDIHKWEEASKQASSNITKICQGLK